MPAASIRARVRAEMIDEIKAIARRHLSTDGANLSLRAVARDMGMVSSAIYRYFASRDELLTALIVDAYNAVGAAAEAGDAAITDREDLRGRWLGICTAVRRWALSAPAEYALLYGSPVPGYAAPPQTTLAATRTPTVMGQIIVDGFSSGVLADAGVEALSEELKSDFSKLGGALAPGIPESMLALGMIGWIHLFGAVSFELFGQLNNAIEARDEYFDYQMRHLAEMIGI
ncbi:MAG TPA: WHG domain-containing protein [Kineosporiaceae bacterium]|nr:WHG domain-containing protein [Kineosporiaceae bacterium]